MSRQNKNQEEGTCYFFKLKCLAALATAAIVAVTVFAAKTSNSAGTITASLATKVLATSPITPITSVGILSAVFPLALTIAGIALLFGAIRLLALLFCRPSLTSTDASPTHPVSVVVGPGLFSGGSRGYPPLRPPAQPCMSEVRPLTVHYRGQPMVCSSNRFYQHGYDQRPGREDHPHPPYQHGHDKISRTTEARGAYSHPCR